MVIPRLITAIGRLNTAQVSSLKCMHGLNLESHKLCECMIDFYLNADSHLVPYTHLDEKLRVKFHIPTLSKFELQVRFLLPL